MNITTQQGYFPGEEETNHIDSDRQLKDKEHVESDEDVHEAEAGNTSETGAEKDKLDGPANDLIGQPSSEDDHHE